MLATKEKALPSTPPRPQERLQHEIFTWAPKHFQLETGAVSSTENFRFSWLIVLFPETKIFQKIKESSSGLKVSERRRDNSVVASQIFGPDSNPGAIASFEVIKKISCNRLAISKSYGD